MQIFSALVSQCAVQNGTVLAAPHARGRAAARAAAAPFGHDPRWLADSPQYDAHLAAEAGAWYNATTEVDPNTGIPYAFTPRRLRYKPRGTLLVLDRLLTRDSAEVRPAALTCLYDQSQLFRASPRVSIGVFRLRGTVAAL